MGEKISHTLTLIGFLPIGFRVEIAIFIEWCVLDFFRALTVTIFNQFRPCLEAQFWSRNQYKLHDPKFFARRLYIKKKGSVAKIRICGSEYSSLYW